MSHELICAWLGLAADEWPPDHYRLLGLRPGESDPRLIEERVHQRLDAVRRYQMMHPEPATEAMNRLAQAFVCLTEPAAKRAYDAALLGTAVATAPDPSEPQTLTEESDALADTVLEERDPLVLTYDPQARAAPPVRRTEPPPLPRPPPLPQDLPVAEEVPAAVAAAEPAVPVVALPEPEPVDPVEELARGRAARRGLGTRRKLYRRVRATRRLLRLWTQAGKYLASPKRRLTRINSADELVRLLDTIREGLRGFPPLLGEAGRPGYLVVALTELEIMPTFQSLGPSQREALSRDWQAGQKLLLAHRAFLRQEMRAMRRRTPAERLLRALRTTVSEQPDRILLLLALLALNLVIWRTFVSDWAYRAVEKILKPVPAKVFPHSAATGHDRRGAAL